MLDGNLQEWEEYEARLSDDSRETFATEVAQETLPGKSFEVDPCASIRSAMAPEHANLSAGAVTLLLGHMPAAFALHQYLNSTEMRQTTLASLLGKAALRSVRVNGSDISIPAYLRLVSHLCSEVAEQSESQGERPAGNADEAPYTFEIPLSRREFRVDHLPRGLQAKFANEDSPAWREAVAEAMHSTRRSWPISSSSCNTGGASNAGSAS